MDATDVSPGSFVAEAPEHPHNQHQQVFTEVAGVMQLNPSPRFSRTKEGIQGPPSHAGQDTDAVLRSAGHDADDIVKLRDVGAVA